MYLSKATAILVIGFATGFASCGEPFPEEMEESFYIASFPDDKRAAVCYTFDDNCNSSFTKIAPLFQEYGYRCTFFIVPGSIKTTTEWAGWKALSAQGFGIGNHTMSHRDLTSLNSLQALDEQVNASFDMIEAKLNQAPLAFAAPGHKTNDLVDSVIGRKHLFNRTDPRDLFVWQGWTSSTTQKDAIKHIDEAVHKRRWHVIAAHGVGDGWEPITESMLRNTLQHCKDNEADIIVETFENIALYKHAREHSTVTVSKGINYYSIEIQSDLPSEKYTYPLTFVLEKHQFPSPYTIYNMSTGEVVEPTVEYGKRLLIPVRVNHTYQIRWREW